MIDRKIPFSFINELCEITLREAAWGYEQQFIAWKDIVDLARSRVADSSDNEIVAELARLNKEQVWRVGELVGKLAREEQPESDGTVRRKWLFFLLAWIFEKRQNIADPLGEVEMVYSDFDYPNEIEGFVRYMPVAADYDPKEHSQINNIRRLFSLWRDYLDKTSMELGCDRGRVWNIADL
jgi:hypothetical protein